MPLAVTIIHESLLQIPPQPLRPHILSPLQGPPSDRIHVHANQRLAFLLVNADVVIVGHICVASPRRPKEEIHHGIGYAVAQRERVGGDAVQWEVLGVALVVAAEEGDDDA